MEERPCPQRLENDLDGAALARCSDAKCLGCILQREPMRDQGTREGRVGREEARGSLITSAVGYTYSWDSNRGGLNPTGRNLLRFSQDFAGVGGDVEYVSTTALASDFASMLSSAAAIACSAASSRLSTDSRSFFSKP